ncbi:MAG TPA: hypothetical protein VHL54_09535 [Actinomycetota bacterium]|nr:hypothetical protein [Actinomycetota bacterium]
MAETEEGEQEQEQSGQDMGSGGSQLGRVPTPESMSTGSAEVRPDDQDAEAPPPQ